MTILQLGKNTYFHIIQVFFNLCEKWAYHWAVLVMTRITHLDRIHSLVEMKYYLKQDQ